MFEAGNVVSKNYTQTWCQYCMSYWLCSYGRITKALNMPYNGIIGLMRYGRNRV